MELYSSAAIRVDIVGRNFNTVGKEGTFTASALVLPSYDESTDKSFLRCLLFLNLIISVSTFTDTASRD